MRCSAGYRTSILLLLNSIAIILSDCVLSFDTKFNFLRSKSDRRCCAMIKRHAGKTLGSSQRRGSLCVHSIVEELLLKSRCQSISMF